MTGAEAIGAKDDRGLRVTSEVHPRSRRHGLALGLALAALAVFAGRQVHAEDLDDGKSVARVFADNCASCHRSPRGLAKGRFRLTLYSFLQQHYASNSSSAWALASYLASAESPQRSPSRAGTLTRSPAHSPTARFSLRPPLPVPSR